MADWRADVIRAVGGNPTAKTLAFLYGWQRKEGGATNNAASFNWLNRTDQGFPTINQVGVAAYPDYRTGISRTAELLQRGYPALTGALRSGAISYQDPNVQGDLNRWLTGKRTPGMSPYVSQVAQLSGAKGAAASVVGNPTAAPAPAVGARQPQSRMQPTLANILPLVAALRSRREGRQRGEPGSLAPVFGALMGLRTAPPEGGQSAFTDVAVNTPGGARPKGGAQGGGFLQLPTSFQGTHVTDGLGWGSKTAQDIMGAPGTGVGSPADGTVIYFHPTGAQG